MWSFPQACTSYALNRELGLGFRFHKAANTSSIVYLVTQLSLSGLHLFLKSSVQRLGFLNLRLKPYDLQDYQATHAAQVLVPFWAAEPFEFRVGC